MMRSKELKINAKAALKGTFWSAVAVTLVAGVITCLSSTIGASESLVAAVAAMLIFLFVDGPIYMGQSNYFLRNTRGEADFKDLFRAFNNKDDYLNIVKIYAIMALKVSLWGLLLVIPGIIKGYEYAMIPYLMSDDPSISSEEAFARSKAMMTGNKFRLFKLHMSFFGWILLSLLTLGIGLIFVGPYMEAAQAEFYRDLKG